MVVCLVYLPLRELCLLVMLLMGSLKLFRSPEQKVVPSLAIRKVLSLLATAWKAIPEWRHSPAERISKCLDLFLAKVA